MRHYSIWSGDYAIVVAPQHREHLEAAGWESNVASVRSGVYRRQWADVGKGAVVRNRGETEYQHCHRQSVLVVAAVEYRRIRCRDSSVARSQSRAVTAANGL